MNRREVLVGAAALAAVPAALAEDVELSTWQKAVAEAAEDAPVIDFVEMEDKYWDAQWQINEYELELSEIRNHVTATKIARKF